MRADHLRRKAIGTVAPAPYVFPTILVACAAIAWLFPRPLMTVALGSLLVIAGFASALASVLLGERRHVPLVTLWDQAGLLVFLGFGISALSDQRVWLAYLEAL